MERNILKGWRRRSEEEGVRQTERERERGGRERKVEVRE